ncbi:hypothetical protein Scep_022692 [Stephania cephalantha]|uniref:Uncharacterized protein n=1 Tax=Stephania cephalantha TaxID=152367 RepID=A0AAP0FGM1_9MAGN
MVLDIVDGGVEVVLKKPWGAPYRKGADHGAESHGTSHDAVSPEIEKSFSNLGFDSANWGPILRIDTGYLDLIDGCWSTHLEEWISLLY